MASKNLTLSLSNAAWYIYGTKNPASIRNLPPEPAGGEGGWRQAASVPEEFHRWGDALEQGDLDAAVFALDLVRDLDDHPATRRLSPSSPSFVSLSTEQRGASPSRHSEPEVIVNHAREAPEPRMDSMDNPDPVSNEQPPPQRPTPHGPLVESNFASDLTRALESSNSEDPSTSTDRLVLEDREVSPVSPHLDVPGISPSSLHHQESREDVEDLVEGSMESQEEEESEQDEGSSDGDDPTAHHTSEPDITRKSVFDEPPVRFGRSWDFKSVPIDPDPNDPWIKRDLASEAQRDEGS
ncbi:uncharacterized protein JCM6883_007127 [Sporobolomyces salmoneus]|uniref:uncharacterized protein n=1 Tax=Sporobolomyces salmoneus TaxID=183962 RepID=UPI00318011B4